MENHSATNRNEVLIHVTIWVTLEDNIQSEKSKTKKSTYCDSIWNVQNEQIHRNRKLIDFCQELGVENGEWLLMVQVSYWVDENVLSLIGMMFCTSL